jgi:hypothetical protein
VSALAAAAAAWPARAQIDWHTIDIWKPYRPEDLGFEVEMPGDPEIEEDRTKMDTRSMRSSCSSA